MASRKKGSTREVKSGETVAVPPGRKTTIKVTKKREHRKSIPMARKDSERVALAEQAGLDAKKAADAATKKAGEAFDKARDAETKAGNAIKDASDAKSAVADTVRTAVDAGLKSVKDSVDNAAQASVEAAGKSAEAKQKADEAKGEAAEASRVANAAVAGVKTEVVTAVNALKPELLKKVEDAVKAETGTFEARVKEAEDKAEEAEGTADEADRKADEALARKSGVSLVTVILIAVICMLVGVVASYFLAMGLTSGQKTDPTLQNQLNEANSKIAKLEQDVVALQVKPDNHIAILEAIESLLKDVHALKARPDQDAKVTELVTRIGEMEKVLTALARMHASVVGEEHPDGRFVTFTIDGGETWTIRR